MQWPTGNAYARVQLRSQNHRRLCVLHIDIEIECSVAKQQIHALKRRKHGVVSPCDLLPRFYHQFSLWQRRVVYSVKIFQRAIPPLCRTIVGFLHVILHKSATKLLPLKPAPSPDQPI